jgi:hypothetical protein
LVHLLALGVRTIIAGCGYRSKFQSQGKLEVSFGDDLRLLRVQLKLVLE